VLTKPRWAPGKKQDERVVRVGVDRAGDASPGRCRCRSLGSLGTDARSRWLVPRPGQAGVAAGQRRVRPGLDHALRAHVRCIRPRPGPPEDPWARCAFAAAFGTNLALNAVLELALLQGPSAALGIGRDHPAGGVDRRPDPACGPGGPHRRPDARALCRLGRLRHRPPRRNIAHEIRKNPGPHLGSTRTCAGPLASDLRGLISGRSLRVHNASTSAGGTKPPSRRNTDPYPARVPASVATPSGGAGSGGHPPGWRA
jgi:hypothetical protein